MPMIRRHVSLGVISVWSVCLGCSNLAELACHNLHFEAAQDLDTCLEPARDRRVADATWHDVVAAHPEQVYSAPYAHGFKDGYRDFIEEGGIGQPPPVPPACYWDLRYQTPQGHAAIDDWYAGFRHGAAVARESGNRRWVIVPASVEAPSGGTETPVRASGPPSPEAPLPELPFPKPVVPTPKGEIPSKRNDSTYTPIQGAAHPEQEANGAEDMSS